MTEIYDVHKDAAKIEQKAVSAGNAYPFENPYTAEKEIAQLLVPHLGDNKYFSELKQALAEAHAGNTKLPEVKLSQVERQSGTPTGPGLTVHEAIVDFPGSQTIGGKKELYSEELQISKADGAKTADLAIHKALLRGHSYVHFSIESKK